MQETYDLMQELTLIDPTQVRLLLNEFEELHLERQGEDPVGPLTAHRVFPLSAASEFIALKDEEDQEVGIVRRVVELDVESRAVLETELEWTYFATTITQVYSIDERFHVPHWDVETERGKRAFEVSSSRRDVRVLGRGRVLIRDADGNRYEIPDYRRLDAASRVLVEGQI